jgi:bifunctional glutamyl/prolyl-tRNA synthetase
LIQCLLIGNNISATTTVTEPSSTTQSADVTSGNPLQKIDSDITAQGNKIRDLKSQKASKEIVEAEVKKLLALKTAFKAVAGKDWDPKGLVYFIFVSFYITGILIKYILEFHSGNNISKEPALVSKPTANNNMTVGEPELKTQIEEQGSKVRQLKDSKVAKNEIDAAVKTLLELKAQYKSMTGQDYAPLGGGNQRSSGAKKEVKKEVKHSKEAPPPAAAKDVGDGSTKKQTKLGLDCKKSENLSDWFSQVIDNILIIHPC